MFPLHHIVHIAEVNGFVKATQNTGQMLVDLQNDNVRLLQDAAGDARGTGEIEIPVLIHGRDAHHGHIHREKMPVVGHHIAKNHGNIAAQPSVAELSLIGGTVPGVVGEVLPARVTLHDLNRTKAQIAPYLYIGQLIPAFRQSLVQQCGKAHVGGVIHPVTAFYGLDGLLRGPKLFPVFIKQHFVHLHLLNRFPARPVCRQVQL